MRQIIILLFVFFFNALLLNHALPQTRYIGTGGQPPPQRMQLSPTLRNLPFGGRGQDGPITISADTTDSDCLIRATTLTVEAGAALTCTAHKAFYIYASQKVVVRGTIHMNGAGYAGGTAITCNGANHSGMDGTNCEAVVSSTAVANCITGAGGAGGGIGSTTYIGGDGGGAGGDGAPGSFGNGSSAIETSFRKVEFILTFSSNKSVIIADSFGATERAGAGGGSGAASSGCTTGSSGAGGNGGGIIYIESPEVIVEAGGVISANGENGGNTSGNSYTGGGGGGGGGLVWIRTVAFTNSGSITANGGTGGRGTISGENGGDGAPGQVIIDSMDFLP